MARRAPLVFQHLENISGAALERYEAIVREYVRGKHGVYALYRRGELYYVGLATNLRNRLRSHLKDRHAHLWDRFSVYLTIQNEHIKELGIAAAADRQTRGQPPVGKIRQVRKPAAAIHARCPNASQPGGRRANRLRAPAEANSNRWQEPRIQAASRAGWLVPSTGDPSEDIQRTSLSRRVRRDGAIRFNGKVYFTVSEAASAARGRRTS